MLYRLLRPQKSSLSQCEAIIRTVHSSMSFSLPYKYITADELAKILKAKPASDVKDIAVVDVRDDDFAGGNIVSAVNVPSSTFHDSVGGLVKRLEKCPSVVFHCALSQQRGPKAARIYAETREASLSSPPTQQIYVLRDGFTGFQSKFRNDPELVEKFNKYYHD
ncbi:Rhodanese-like domain-containing protein [Kockovaella imperatae]|uniref:Rhodanese-like domain-containing protein n=1 Tax=Kockovaella imperatae TaxID=4999 RepID=A0A1Y1U6Y6_9TREE|nr:Rhodanese-like domain-containing protein [Kockovaella imperatae]ORX33791.1 Rhodanese-like domain-containing protein [Kockovaella imperatae]